MQACPWEWDSPWEGMGQHALQFPCFAVLTINYGTKIDKQEIENLLNEHSDSEYECQNDNEL